MRNRRLAIAGLALIAGLGLTGCGPDDSTSTGATGSGAAATQAAGKLDPAADLTAAVSKLGEQSVKVDMDMAGALSMTGVADPKAGTARMSMDMGALGKGTKIEMRKLGDDLYMKFGGQLGEMLKGGTSTKPWMHIDATKLGEGSNFALPKDDPAGTKAMLQAVTSVERVGTDGFKGTLDLTKSPRFNKGDQLKSLGDKATKIPFTAKKDSEGRLVELTLDMSAIQPGTGKIKTKYSDFGTPVSVEAPPASQVGEMPSQLSGVLNA
ncbi:hypothetical protein ACPCHT_25010 [Nucisporomicrobium flavum]|jgi:hypothetical protein|uniref:hypothetical protein n=1 Tax=Nucisporomicrobium flavum TaxID=2785915 RepID=UPI0018F439ED|nr:hypothetical protein [Nucisporomicrobium flavum]